MEEYMVWVWLGIIVVSVIIEACTMELTSVWFAIAGVAALILSLIPGVPWWVEFAVFMVLSIVLLLLLRKIACKYLLKGKGLKTNIEALQSLELTVIDETTNDSAATVKHNGIVWSAIEESGKKLAKNEKVTVIRVEGNKLIVKEKEN